MKRTLYCWFLITIFAPTNCCSALKKPTSLNLLPVELQNMIVESCYGPLNESDLLSLLEKAQQNDAFTKEELILCERLLESVDALSAFDTTIAQPHPYSFFSCLRRFFCCGHNSADMDTDNTDVSVDKNIILLKKILYLLKRKNGCFEFSRGEKNLIAACYLGLPHVVDNLIETGTDVDTHETSGNHSSPLHIAIQTRHNQIVQKLIAAGASLNKQNIHAQVPLDNAIQINNLDAIKLLIDAGANVSYQDVWTMLTPLHIATFHNNLTAVQLLLDAGANPFLRDVDELNVFDLADSLGRQEILAELNN